MSSFSRIVLSLLLVVSHTGWGYTVHYCKGSIAYIASIFSEEQTCMSACHVEEVETKCCSIHQTSETQDCCSDQLIQVDVDDIGEYGANQLLVFSAVLQGNEFQFFELNAQVYKDFFLTEVKINGPPLYVLFQQFLFYDMV